MFYGSFRFNMFEDMAKSNDSPFGLFFANLRRKDPQYFRNELVKMKNDPRSNPNHGRSMEDQEFWNEARPEVKNVNFFCFSLG